MQKRVFFIHGWCGYPEEGWRPWLKRQLEAEKYRVQSLTMPDSEHPRCGEWIQYLSKQVGEPDEECILIGHSLGCITILRYLEELHSGKIGSAVMVASFADDLGEGYEELTSFFNKPVDWEKVKNACNRFVVIHSKDDHVVSIRYAEDVAHNLDCELVVEKGYKHFSGDDGVNDVPAILEAVLKA